MVKQVHNPVRTYGPETVQEITADEIVDWQLVKNLIIVLSGGTLLSVGFKFDIDLIFFYPYSVVYHVITFEIAPPPNPFCLPQFFVTTDPSVTSAHTVLGLRRTNVWS